METRPAVEYQRLLRAIALIRAKAVTRIGPRQFEVRGNEEPEYVVDLDGDPMCYCLDMFHSPRQHRLCKHILACRLATFDPAMLGHMVDVIEREEARKKQVA